MATDHCRVDAQMAQGTMLDEPGFLRQIVERVLQELLEAQMTEHIGAAPYERSVTRKGQRNGYKPRMLRTRVGTLNLLVPQDRQGTFSTRLFARYQRNEKALVLALMQMYVEGVSTRKVKDITESLCGTSFSKSLISSLATRLDAELGAWRSRPLEGEAYPYLFVDARYEKARERRTRVVRILPNQEACSRLVTALCVEQSEEWVTGRRYLDMRELEERPNEKREAEEVMLMQP
jgi:putative transposase